MSSNLTERVHLRVIVMPCCKHVLCWVNPRLPTYCPECGSPVLALLRPDALGSVRVSDEGAYLKYST